VEIAVGKDDEAAVLGFGVAAGLFLADERVFILGLGFEDDEGEALVVEQEKVDVALGGRFKVFAECVEISGAEGDAGLKLEWHLVKGCDRQFLSPGSGYGHFATRFCEVLIRFGTSFDGARFASIGA